MRLGGLSDLTQSGKAGEIFVLNSRHGKPDKFLPVLDMDDTALIRTYVGFHLALSCIPGTVSLGSSLAVGTHLTVQFPIRAPDKVSTCKGAEC